ncbi:hypothetical protein [Tenacibaculum sp. 190524A05c]|uniref:hypothetical protein n=1 Tax=Tenacibaculum platacis TaxID=3137852 RepID=UPI0031FA4E5B
MDVLIDKLQLQGRNLEEVLVLFKNELERLISTAGEYPIKIINGQKYINVNGTWSALLDEVVVSAKAATNLRAFVVAPLGIRLHKSPLPNDYEKTSRIYNPGEEVLLVKHVKNAKGWAYIRTKEGKFGYIQRTHLSVVKENASLDRFTKKFHFVKDAEVFENTITNNYPDFKPETGHDYRTITQAFRFLNETSEHDHGIYLRSRGKSFLEATQDFVKDLHDPWMHDARSLYGDIRLTKHKIVRLPNAEYIEYLKQTGTINVRPGFWNTTIDFGNVVVEVVGAAAGFIIGLVEGFLVAIWEALEGIIDLISQVVGVFKKIISGDLIDDFKKLYNTIKDLSKDELLELASAMLGKAGEAIKKILNDWNKLSTFEKARTIGKIVGAIILEIVLAVFTGGSANAAKWAGKLGKVGKGLMKIANLGDKIKDKVANKIPKKFKNKKKKNDYNDENDPKNIQRQLLLNQARIIAESMDANDSTIDQLLTTLTGTAKLYPKLKVRWPHKLKRDNIYSIGMIASDEKPVDKHFSSGKDKKSELDEKVEIKVNDKLKDKFKFNQRETDQILNQLNTETGGGKLANRLMSDSYDDYEGYKDLLSSLKKKGDHNVQKVNDALDVADDLKLDGFNEIFFERSTKDFGYDIDVGAISSSAKIPSVAVQLKFLTSHKQIFKNLKKGFEQLQKVPKSFDKILDMKVPLSYDDFVSSNRKETLLNRIIELNKELEVSGIKVKITFNNNVTKVF